MHRPGEVFFRLLAHCGAGVSALLEVPEAAGQILLFRIRPVLPGKIRQLTLEADHFTELRLVVYLDVDDHESIVSRAWRSGNSS